MIGFVLGGVLLFGLARAFRRARRGRWHMRHGFGHAHGCGYHGRGGYGDDFDGDDFDGGGYGRRGWGGGGWGLRGLMRQLNLRPEQRASLRDAKGEIKAVGVTLRDELSGLREDLAQALRADSFDEELLGAASAKIDGAVDTFRKAVISMVARLHTTLDPQQRAALADRLDGAGQRGRASSREALWL